MTEWKVGDRFILHSRTGVVCAVYTHGGRFDYVRCKWEDEYNDLYSTGRGFKLNEKQLQDVEKLDEEE